MKLFAVAIFACLATAYAKEEQAEKIQEKRRAVPQYATASTKYAPATEPSVAYATAKVIQPQLYLQAKSQGGGALRYTQAPAQYNTSPQQFDYEQQQQVQQVTYVQQPATKLQATKVAYAPAATQTVHYSPASDVSSFSYSSPLVSYNSLGLLTQHSGKIAASASAQPSQQVTYSATPQQQITYTPKVTYSSAPATSSKAEAQQPSIAYKTVPQYQVAYQQAAHQLAQQQAAQQQAAQQAAQQQAAQQQAAQQQAAHQPTYTFQSVPAYQSDKASAQAYQSAQAAALQAEKAYQTVPAYQSERAYQTIPAYQLEKALQSVAAYQSDKGSQTAQSYQPAQGSQQVQYIPVSKLAYSQGAPSSGGQQYYLSGQHMIALSAAPQQVAYTFQPQAYSVQPQSAHSAQGQSAHEGQQVTYVAQGEQTAPRVAYSFAPQYTFAPSSKAHAVNYA